MNQGVNIPEYEVSQFNKLFKEVVENNFDYVRIRGEISELKNAASGHLYLTLKDATSILNGTIWSQKKSHLKIQPEVGMEVIVTGKISTYAKSISTYSISIDKLELTGEGALLKIIEDRKTRLKGKGIFDEEHKKKIPFLPNKIGVITSPTGSVIHDIINRIKDRFPISIDIWPVPVQGISAAENIIKALEGFQDKSYKGQPDVIIIARGGGNTEDLMPFNDEKLALAVYGSTIPIISAIGHETDNTIIDYVSDLRASTPTSAAEKAVPVLEDLKREINFKIQRLNLVIDNIIDGYKLKFINLAKYLKVPNMIISSFNEKFNFAYENLIRNLEKIYDKNYQQIGKLSQLLRLPYKDFKNNQNNLEKIKRNLHQNFDQKILLKKDKLKKSIMLLKSNSIGANLKKGYSIILKSNNIINNSNKIKKEDIIKIQFTDQLIDIKIKKFS